MAYYRSNRPHWAYAFVCFRFWTGTRPSEATALRWSSVDLLNAKARITLSRHLGEENATKTRTSKRTVTLLPNVVDLLKSILPLRVEPNSYVFTDGQGKTHRPIRVQSLQLPARPARLRVEATPILQLAPYLHQRCVDPGLQSEMDSRADRNEHRNDSRALRQVHS